MFIGMLNVAIYCRLSEEDKNKPDAARESESIQNQRSMLETYAKEKGWNIYRIYCDEDYSGIDAKRPEFNRLLKDAEEKKFSVVLCKTQSRFTRDMEVMERYIHNKFIEWNIRFVALVDNVDTEDKGNKKSRQINGLVNEWFLEDLSENIRSVLTNKRRRGQYIGSFFPYGYIKDPENKTHLLIDSDAGRNVRQIFDWYLAGYGITKIAQMLNDAKIPNPTFYKKQQGYAYQAAKHGSSPLWSYATVRGILRNALYIGNMIQGKYKHISYKNQKLVRAPKEDWIVAENTHEPIIQKETFESVQERLSSGAHPGKAGKVSALAGKIRCGCCGNSMHKTYAKNTAYLSCRTKEQVKKGCDGANIRYDLVEDAVRQKISAAMEQYQTSEFLLANIKQLKKTDQRVTGMESRAETLKRSLSAIPDILLNLYMDKSRGILDETRFQKMSDALMERQRALETELFRADGGIRKAREEEKNTPPLQEMVERYENPDTLKRELAEELIDYIEIGRGEGRKKTIGIHWKF